MPHNIPDIIHDKFSWRGGVMSGPSTTVTARFRLTDVQGASINNSEIEAFDYGVYVRNGGKWS